MFAFVGLAELVPLLVFAVFVFGVWSVLSLISNRNSRAQDRLERISRPASLAEIEDPKAEEGALPGLMETRQGAVHAVDAARPSWRQSQLKIELANAGFRSESAVAVYLGIRFVMLHGVLPDRHAPSSCPVRPDARRP